MAPSNRRGSEVIEFAITLPILLILVSGMIDFGWYYYQQSRLHDAVRHGARVGAVTEQEDAPLAAAQGAVVEQLAVAQVPFTPVITTRFTYDVTGDQLVEVGATAPYVGLWALLNTPYRLAATVTMRMEDQP
jgi:Flp pilus assembly protein TadG